MGDRLPTNVLMPDDTEINLDEIDQNINNRNKVQERIIELSNKAKTIAEERDEKSRLLAEKDIELAQSRKENEFLSGFSKISAKYPNAGDHFDEIKGKVLAGYEMEDAAVATLAKAGKLSTGVAPEQVTGIAGGSASINLPNQGEKTLGEMSKDEKLAKLLEAEKRGEIMLS